MKVTHKQQSAKLGMISDAQARTLSERVVNELKDDPDVSAGSRQSISSA